MCLKTVVVMFAVCTLEIWVLMLDLCNQPNAVVVGAVRGRNNRAIIYQESDSQKLSGLQRTYILPIDSF